MNGWLLILIVMTLFGHDTVEHIEHIGPFVDERSCLVAAKRIFMMTGNDSNKVKGFCSPQTAPASFWGLLE